MGMRLAIANVLFQFLYFTPSQTESYLGLFSGRTDKRNGQDLRSTWS